MKLKGLIKIKPYPVIENAVETGVAYGWHRAHKHNDKPTPDKIRDAIAEAVMASISEAVEF
jgi:hypothetical protein